ncbi:MAG TPA: hypothetical protein VHE12_12015 [bacterium]|nr:hypothetical protein [bacterium]
MNFFRKNLYGLAFASFLALGSVLTVEAFHHHDALEIHTDRCSVLSYTRDRPMGRPSSAFSG